MVNHIPLSEIQNLARLFHERARECGARAVIEMHDTGNDILATGYSGSAGAYEMCARMLDHLISEWNVPPDSIPEVQL